MVILASSRVELESISVRIAITVGGSVTMSLFVVVVPTVVTTGTVILVKVCPPVASFILSKSNPASPVADTSSVFAGVVDLTNLALPKVALFTTA